MDLNKQKGEEKDQSIRLVHKNATYNCCADEIKISLAAEVYLLRLNENEIVAHPCTCLCCYDVEATIINLVPGIYALEFCWDEWETGNLECITLNERKSRMPQIQGIKDEVV